MALTQTEFGQLIKTHAAALYRTAYRLIGDQHEAEDVVQDTFRSVWRSRDRFDKNRSERAWLVTILRRRVIDRWRRVNKPPQTAEASLFEIPIAGEDPLRDDFTDEMQFALQQLKPEVREALLLVVVGELTHQEAADLLAIPLGTILSRVSRGRKQLRSYLTTHSK